MVQEFGDEFERNGCAHVGMPVLHPSPAPASAPAPAPAHYHHRRPEWHHAGPSHAHQDLLMRQAEGLMAGLLGAPVAPCSPGPPSRVPTVLRARPSPHKDSPFKNPHIYPCVDASSEVVYRPSHVDAVQDLPASYQVVTTKRSYAHEEAALDMGQIKPGSPSATVIAARSSPPRGSAGRPSRIDTAAVQVIKADRTLIER